MRTLAEVTDGKRSCSSMILSALRPTNRPSELQEPCVKVGESLSLVRGTTLRNAGLNRTY